MKIAITGGKGMLGRTLQKKFAGDEVVVADLPEWDITDGEAVRAAVETAVRELGCIDIFHCNAGIYLR